MKYYNIITNIAKYTNSGTLTGGLSGTKISATYMTANSFSCSGTALTNLNVSNAATGTWSISRGGIGTTT